MGMVTFVKSSVGDVGGTKDSLSPQQATDPGSKARLKYYYRPEERVRPIVFDVFDAAVAFMGINWNQLGHIVEAPDNNTSWRWKHEKHKPSYKYVLKCLHAVLNEGFRKERHHAATVSPFKQLTIRELEKLPEGYEFSIPEHPDYPFELQGDWQKKEGEFWTSKSKRILRKTKDLVSSDKLLIYMGELLLEDGI